MQCSDLSKTTALALGFGFSHAAPLTPDTLTVYGQVRDMCAADLCGMYAHCWTCPPACGSIEQHADKLAGYTKGIIVQTTGILEDRFDYEGMKDTGSRHKQLLCDFAGLLKIQHPDLLALGSGGCSVCETCTYPSEPCRHPDEALCSMEAYGLLVSEVCQKNNIPYSYGEGSITYVGCYLWN